MGTTGISNEMLQTQNVFTENDKVIIYDLSGKIIYTGMLKDFYQRKIKVFAYIIASPDGKKIEKETLGRKRE